LSNAAEPYHAPRWLRGGHLPTLVLNAKNAPFLPARHLPRPEEIAPMILLEQPDEGGHAGFPSGTFPGHLDWLPQRLLAFFRGHAHPVR
jgi:hypothetical protein